MWGSVEKLRLAHGAVAVAVAWSLVVAFSLQWSLYQHDREIVSIAQNVARTNLDKDAIFRHWGVVHGGVYVPVTPQTPPNPYLDPELVPEREITTPSGRLLTLINPVDMIRQLYGALPGQNPPRARVVSIRPLRPEDMADPWEAAAIAEFARGGSCEKSALQGTGTQRQVRLMRPFFAKQLCLEKCHAGHGYREGEVMGGISITVPMAPFVSAVEGHVQGIWIVHLLLWALGLLGIGLSYVGMSQRNDARQRSLEALQRSEERVRSLIENALDIITVLDNDGVIIFESPSLARVLGHQPVKLLGQPLTEILHPDDRPRLREILHRLAGAPEESETFEMRCRHRDGSWRILEAAGKRLSRNLPPAAYVINSRDITPRKEAEAKLLSYQAQLRSLASRLSLAEEQARRQIATGLHENIGQNLSVLNLKLGALQRQVADSEIAAQLREVAALLDLTMKDTRSLTFELSPPILYDIGLEASVKWAAARFAHRHGIVCRTEDDGAPKPLDEDLRGVLYRSVLEALNNILKHAAAKTVTISMREQAGCIRITIVDDGVGFDPEVACRTGQTAGFGLFSIRERLELLNGRMEVDSAPGRGTRLEMEAPLKDAAGALDTVPS